MEEIYVVYVRIGLQMKFQFEGALIEADDASSKFTFGECNEHYAPKPNGDVLVFDFTQKTVGFNSQHFSMAMDIRGHKKVGNNYHFKCATDLCRVDVYICEKALWEEKQDAIFY